jgi:hypothetical protein
MWRRRVLLAWEAGGGLKEQDDAPEELEATHETMLERAVVFSFRL